MEEQDTFSPFPQMDYAGRTTVVNLPYSKGTWEILTRPTPFDAMRLAEFMKNLTETAAELTKRYNYDVSDVYPALGSMTVRWSFTEEVTIESIMSRDQWDLKAVLQVFNDESIPFFRQVATDEQLKTYSLQLDGNRRSRRNGMRQTSSRRRGGRGGNTSTPRK